MGFLERLEQKKLQKEIAIQRQQRNQRREERQPVRNLESVEDQEGRSKGYYGESGCRLLASKLSEIIGGNIQGYETTLGQGPDIYTLKVIEDFKLDLRRNDQNRFDFRTHVVFLTWQTNKKTIGRWTNRWIDNCVAIETCPSGEIYFHGSLFGSSVLSKDQWQEDKECLERALEKAYHRPKQKRRVYDDTPKYPDLGGLGM